MLMRLIYLTTIWLITERIFLLFVRVFFLNCYVAWSYIIYSHVPSGCHISTFWHLTSSGMNQRLSLSLDTFILSWEGQMMLGKCRVYLYGFVKVLFLLLLRFLARLSVPLFILSPCNSSHSKDLLLLLRHVLIWNLKLKFCFSSKPVQGCLWFVANMLIKM